jgi:hypothetical protein
MERAEWLKHMRSMAEKKYDNLGKGCLHIKRLEDVDLSILNKLIVEAVKRAKNRGKRMQRCR